MVYVDKKWQFMFLFNFMSQNHVVQENKKKKSTSPVRIAPFCMSSFIAVKNLR